MNSLCSIIFQFSLVITIPIPDNPGLPLLAPSILIINKWYKATSNYFINITITLNYLLIYINKEINHMDETLNSKVLYTSIEIFLDDHENRSGSHCVKQK